MGGAVVRTGIIPITARVPAARSRRLRPARPQPICQGWWDRLVEAEPALFERDVRPPPQHHVVEHGDAQQRACRRDVSGHGYIFR